MFGRRPNRLPNNVEMGVWGTSSLDGEFTKLYADGGLPSIAPERLLRALLLQVFYTIRSERQLIKQLHYNLLYRWFVGLGVDEPVWVPTGVGSRDRDAKGSSDEQGCGAAGLGAGRAGRDE
jgi:transposase